MLRSNMELNWLARFIVGILITAQTNEWGAKRWGPGLRFRTAVSCGLSTMDPTGSIHPGILQYWGPHYMYNRTEIWQASCQYKSNLQAIETLWDHIIKRFIRSLKQFLIRYSPISQLFPLCLEGQVQLYPLNLSMQVPFCWHGSLAHSSRSETLQCRQKGVMTSQTNITIHLCSTFYPGLLTVCQHV